MHGPWMIGAELGVRAGADRASRPHRHDFDESIIVVRGRYVAVLDGKEHALGPGDELFIPRGTEQSGRCTAGTRSIHAFGGRRIRGGNTPATDA